MSARFQIDSDDTPKKSVLVDPEAFDASEQQFAASLSTSQAKFVVAHEETGSGSGSHAQSLILDETLEETPVVTTPEPPVTPAAEAPDPNAWRSEVSVRLDRYRSRRKTKEPRYPSLRLKFEPDEPVSTSTNLAEALSSEPAIEREIEPRATTQPSPVEPAARVLPFRRAGVAPPRPLDELADPVFLAPRILEAPDVLQAQPALGGILIEPVEDPAAEKRPGLDLPVQPAGMSQRLIAVATDVLLILAAIALFAYIFFRVTAIVPPVSQIALMTLALAALLWPAYQYALLVYSGATPGLKLAKLHLARFDGSPVPRRLRRWRVIATALSGLSLGLGYAWCILDEDQLCWHDRITGTYMAPKGGN